MSPRKSMPPIPFPGDAAPTEALRPRPASERQARAAAGPEADADRQSPITLTLTDEQARGLDQLARHLYRLQGPPQPDRSSLLSALTKIANENPAIRAAMAAKLD